MRWLVRLGRSFGITSMALLLVLGSTNICAAANPHAEKGPAITSVVITASGGEWPTCRQTATITYASRSPLSITGAPTVPFGCANIVGSSGFARVRGTGTVDIGMEYEYTVLSGPLTWAWRVWTYGPRAQLVETSTYTFTGTCPASGVIASWTP